jgi:hypothetical protein
MDRSSFIGLLQHFRIASTKNVSMVQDRMGSVGGEIMRHSKVFDYTNQQLFLRKNILQKVHSVTIEVALRLNTTVLRVQETVKWKPYLKLWL